MKPTIFILFISLILFSCKQGGTEQTGEQNPLSHSTPTMIDVLGTYEGDMPCDDCDKEVVNYEFKMDRSLIATFSKVGGEGGSTAGIGTWELSGDQLKCNVNNDVLAYTVKGNQLQQKVDGKIYMLIKKEK